MQITDILCTLGTTLGLGALLILAGAALGALGSRLFR
jgi:hypothetical protein